MGKASGRHWPTKTSVRTKTPRSGPFRAPIRPRSGVFSCTHAAVIFSHQETKHGKQTTETFLGLIRPRWKVFRRNHRAFVSETREGGLVIFENGGKLGQDFGVEKKNPGSEMFAAALQFLWCQSADSCRHLMPAILRRKKAQAFLALNASTGTAAGPTTQCSGTRICQPCEA